MTIGMLAAGIGCLLAGLLAIGFGIPINEFGLGNTLILSGAIAACTGLILLSVWVVAKQLKTISMALGAGTALDWNGNPSQSTATAVSSRPVTEDMSGHEQGVAEAGGPVPAAPWLGEAAGRDRSRQEAPEPPAAKPKRNLMFSSTSRRERERAQVRAGDPSATDPRSAAAGPPVREANEPPPASFDDAWPKSERARPPDAPPQRRAARSPSDFSETAATRQTPVEDQPPVTVLKSGVVDGMAYSLYSDGSIEAQLPEGMMRFASIDELRAHLDQRS
jgi:hypothetical protein